MKKVLFMIAVFISIIVIGTKVYSIATSIDKEDVGKIASKLYKNMKNDGYETKVNLNGVMEQDKLQEVTEILSAMTWHDFSLSANYRVDVTKHASAKFKAEINPMDSDTKLDTTINQIVAKANSFNTPRAKLEYVNDTIVSMCKYDTKLATSPFQKGSNAWSAYGCLIEGNAVCAGYANAMTVICERLNIPVIRIYSKGMNGIHTWNSVYINGQWLMVDVTWNDPTYIGEKPEGLTDDNRKYFLITENKLNEYGYKYDKNIYELTKSIKYPELATN